MGAPDIASSTREERERFVKNTFRCIADCDSCGICQVFRGKQPEIAYEDYIEGRRDFWDVSGDYR